MSACTHEEHPDRPKLTRDKKGIKFDWKSFFVRLEKTSSTVDS